MKWDGNHPFELFIAILIFHFIAIVFLNPSVEPATHVTLHKLNMEAKGVSLRKSMMLNNFDYQQGKPNIVVSVYITPTHSLYPASVQAVSTAVFF